jgi:hypothetical protein
MNNTIDRDHLLGELLAEYNNTCKICPGFPPATDYLKSMEILSDEELVMYHEMMRI